MKKARLLECCLKWLEKIEAEKDEDQLERDGKREIERRQEAEQNAKRREKGKPGIILESASEDWAGGGIGRTLLRGEGGGAKSRELLSDGREGNPTHQGVLRPRFLKDFRGAISRVKQKTLDLRSEEKGKERSERGGEKSDQPHLTKTLTEPCEEDTRGL